MFEGAIAAFLNRLLGRYVEDLDTEQFNVGIFSGDTCLTDLKLKPEALVRRMILLGNSRWTIFGRQAEFYIAYIFFCVVCFQYQLGLPIRVEIGLIGKIILKIPWSGLFSQPIVICIEVWNYIYYLRNRSAYWKKGHCMDIFIFFKDIYAVAVPALSGPYDPETQKRLIRAEKKKILEDLKEDEIFRAGILNISLLDIYIYII